MDCTRFSGRKRLICEGKSGLPPDVEAAYRRRWEQQPQGLGDTVYQVLSALGVHALWKKINPDCGCEERRQALNRLFPYGTGDNQPVK